MNEELKVGDFVRAKGHTETMTVNRVWEDDNLNTWCECSWVGEDSLMHVDTFIDGVLTKV